MTHIKILKCDAYEDKNIPNKTAQYELKLTFMTL